MALFEKDKDEKLSGPGTVVGTNVKLSGILKDVNDIIVHGKVEGEVISSHQVTITETAEIKGPVTAQNVDVAGTVNGSIQAESKVEILPTGKVYGSITMKNLIIHSGAVFIGKSAMPDRKGEHDGANGEVKADRREGKVTDRTAAPTTERTRVITYDAKD